MRFEIFDDGFLVVCVVASLLHVALEKCGGRPMSGDGVLASLHLLMSGICFFKFSPRFVGSRAWVPGLGALSQRYKSPRSSLQVIAKAQTWL